MLALLWVLRRNLFTPTLNLGHYSGSNRKSDQIFALSDKDDPLYSSTLFDFLNWSIRFFSFLGEKIHVLLILETEEVLLLFSSNTMQISILETENIAFEPNWDQIKNLTDFSKLATPNPFFRPLVWFFNSDNLPI